MRASGYGRSSFSISDQTSSCSRTKQNCSSRETSIAKDSPVELRVSLASLDTVDIQELPQHRRVLANILYSTAMTSTVGIIVVCNFVVILIDTDIRASGGDTPAWVTIVNCACLVLYASEVMLRIIVEHWQVLYAPCNVFDICVVMVSGICEIIELWGAPLAMSSVSMFRVFRVFRMLRLVRALRFISMFEELKKLLQMFACCFKTLFWAVCLIFLMMTVWSTMAVELIHPLIQEIALTGVWDDCQRCPRAYSSVMQGNLSLFQNIVAEDDWGRMSLPVIEKYPWTAVIFVGSLITLVFGMLNLIVAVIVDAFAEVRASDVKSRSKELQKDQLKEQRSLERMFTSVDPDNTGILTLEKLQRSVDRVPEFRARLRLMDIDDDDLRRLFQLMDSTGNGIVETGAFIHILQKMKFAESKATTVMIKHYISSVCDQHKELNHKLDGLDSRVQDLRDWIVSDSTKQTLFREHLRHRLADAISMPPPFSPAARSDSSI